MMRPIYAFIATNVTNHKMTHLQGVWALGLYVLRFFRETRMQIISHKRWIWICVLYEKISHTTVNKWWKLANFWTMTTAEDVRRDIRHHNIDGSANNSKNYNAVPPNIFGHWAIILLIIIIIIIILLCITNAPPNTQSPQSHYNFRNDGSNKVSSSHNWIIIIIRLYQVTKIPGERYRISQDEQYE